MTEITSFYFRRSSCLFTIRWTFVSSHRRGRARMTERKLRRKTVTVSFSGDDDVVQHIIDVTDGKTGRETFSISNKNAQI